MTKDDEILTGIVLDEHLRLTMQELSAFCNVSIEVVRDMVTEGVISPIGKDPDEWVFLGPDVRRIHTVIRLERDLGVNLPGAALALDLLDEIEKLRNR
jgi:chaperone modulatory protein CbpM